MRHSGYGRKVWAGAMMTAAAAILATGIGAVGASAQELTQVPPFSINDLMALKPASPVPYVAVAAPRPAHVVSTRHKGRFDGQAIQYTATVGETFIPGDDNKDAEAAMVTIAYVRDGVRDPAHRPVAFIFNGGPGASSTPLQGGLAPRIPDKSDIDSGRYIDNPDSVLDAVDLVFIDPIGTGFSRALSGKPVEQYWSTRGDAQSVRYFIQTWLREHHRETSPRYIVGESYGTARAGHIAEIGEDLNLDGIVLISSTGSPGGEDLDAATRFPTFATAAAFHGKGRDAGKDARQVFDDNVRFAEGPYLAALVKGDRLSAEERDAMAGEIADRLGLPKDFILAHNLRPENYDFMLNLLKAEGQRTGQLDARAKGDLETYAKRNPPYDDPSMSLGAKGTPNTPTSPASNEVEKAFLAHELGYESDEGYFGLNLKMLFNFKHDVDFNWRPMDAISKLMHTQAKLRLLLTGGLYDITTPFHTAEYNLSHADVPRDRTTVRGLESGHEVYGGKNIVVFNQILRDFVRPAEH
ncbi:MAG: hypothetical protein PW843_19240 [Azospirillaceae bacterium]|nr:hypothetical protein [Azospirillaceae bacterium]